jgi:hypothetical protein
VNLVNPPAAMLAALAVLAVLVAGCADYVGDDLRTGDYPRRDLVAFDEAAVLAAQPDEPRTPDPVDPRTLEVGDCFDDLGGPPLRAFGWGQPVDRVPCTSAHRYEVYARPALGDHATDPWPGTSLADETADRRCVEAFEAFVGVPWSSSELDFLVLVPDESTWSGGDTRASCALFDLGLRPLVGSAEGAGR